MKSMTLAGLESLHIMKGKGKGKGSPYNRLLRPRGWVEV